MPMEMTKKELKAICEKLKIFDFVNEILMQIKSQELCLMLKPFYLRRACRSLMACCRALVKLDSINLCKNMVQKIENLGHIKALHTLLLGDNKLKELDDVRGIIDVPSIQVLDIQNNHIEDPAIIDIIQQLPNLGVLYLQGNPCIKKMKNYRKTMITRCKSLKYLDDRPVFDDERLRAEAFVNAWDASGGDGNVAREAERVEMDRQRQEKKDKEERNFQAFNGMVRNAKAEHIAKEQAARAAALAAGRSADEMKGDLSVLTVNPYTGEPIVSTEDPAMLRAYREAKWAVVVGGYQPWEAASGDLPIYSAVWAALGVRASKRILAAREADARAREATNVAPIGKKIDDADPFDTAAPPPLESVSVSSSAPPLPFASSSHVALPTAAKAHDIMDSVTDVEELD